MSDNFKVCMQLKAIFQPEKKSILLIGHKTAVLLWPAELPCFPFAQRITRASPTQG